MANHLTVIVPKGSEVLIKLTGYDPDGDKLTAKVITTPDSGALYQLSQVFSDYGYAPKQGDRISTGMTTVTGSKNRILYAPPSNTNPPTGKWSWFQYKVYDGTTWSEAGIVWLVPEHRNIVASDFATGLDGWSVQGNGARANAMTAGGLVFEPFSRGLLNHYILNTEAEINLNRVTKDDDTRWYFVAPEKFLHNHAAAYGGKLKFDMATAAGDFKSENINLKPMMAVLDCASCNRGAGVRLAVFGDQMEVKTDGSTQSVAISLTEKVWKEDPKNVLNAWGHPTQCEMVEVLSGLTGFKILGDHTKWYESVAIDNVAYEAGSCTWRHVGPLFRSAETSPPHLFVVSRRTCLMPRDLPLRGL